MQHYFANKLPNLFFLRQVKTIALLCALSFALITHAQDSILTHGHAHNDYLHKRPLFDALSNGFTSIEVDVYLFNNKLVASHLPIGLYSKKSMEELYFHPLDSIIRSNGGHVYEGSDAPLILMVDFKEGGSILYPPLQALLKKYEPLITLYQGDSIVRKGPLQILISGSKPVLADTINMVTLDMGLNALKLTAAQKHATRFSDNWNSHFTWNGKGPMPEAQKKELDALIYRAHQLHKHIRFYHIPDKPKVWRTLLDAGLDWINTDKLKEFRRFYLTNYNQH